MIPLVSKNFKNVFSSEGIKYLWKNTKILLLLFASGEENGLARK
jgi:hypothetical protein